MKKISALLVAVAMVLGMSQCKKNVETIANESITGGMSITVDVDNNSKVNVDPTSGSVQFAEGDKILVAYGGSYVGTLTHNGSNFQGVITNIPASDPDFLYFYFLGNREGTLTPGSTASCEVSITDQTSSYPVISAGASTVQFSSEVTSYTANLKNKCALVKFNVTNHDADGVETPIYVDYSSVTVDFTKAPNADGAFAYKKGEGKINLAAVTSGSTEERWAILFPQPAKSTQTITKFETDSKHIISVNQQPITTAVVANGYQTTGYNVTVSDVYFTIDASAGTKAYFASGNLQWSPQSGGIWRIAKHQYDMIGNGEIGNVSGSGNQHINDPEYTGWIDQFGYGTSGWSGGDATAYQPNSISVSSNDYIKHNLTGAYAEADWGVHNVIYNPNRGGNDAAGTWRTPTIQEYQNVIGKDATNPRPTESKRFAKANIEDVFGMIIIPDNWVSATYSLSSINDSKANYTSNVISYADWDKYLEPSGCVFLPAAGYREGASTFKNLSALPDKVNGYYWTSEYRGYISPDYSAYRYNFYYNGIGGLGDSNLDYSGKTHAGRPVRLIRNR